MKAGYTVCKSRVEEGGVVEVVDRKRFLLGLSDKPNNID